MSETAEGIVLLHGIFRTHRNMAKLAAFLEKNGYCTLNLGYPSTTKTIEDIAEHVHASIAPFAKDLPKINFVCFSMGCLVTRAYLHRFRPANLGRVVMLAPPNKGSEVADTLKDWGVYRKFFGPGGQQLVTHLPNAGALFGEVNYELGILAGNRTIDPISSYIIGQPNDGKVSVESTRLAGMVDHLVIPAAHTLFPTSKLAWQQTLHFLSEGRFKR